MRLRLRVRPPLMSILAGLLSVLAMVLALFRGADRGR